MGNYLYGKETRDYDQEFIVRLECLELSNPSFVLSST